MNKKAVQVELKTLLLFIAIAIILIIFTGKIVSFFQVQNDKNLCLASIIAASKTKIAKTQSPIKIQCKAQLLDIDDKGIYKNGNAIQSFSKDNSANSDKLNKAIADELADCVDISFNRTINPFGELGGKNKCILCSRIKFSSNFNEKIPLTNNFVEWTSSHEIKPDVSYFDYLGMKDIQEKSNIPFENKGAYYIVMSVAVSGAISPSPFNFKTSIVFETPENVSSNCAETYN